MPNSKKLKSNLKNKNFSILETPKGISREIVIQISKLKNEPSWMLDLRLKALEIFNHQPLPAWGPDLSDLDFSSLTYYTKPFPEKKKSWDEVPLEIKNTFTRLGIPEAERKYLAGIETQYDSEAVYGSLKNELHKKGVIFTDTDSALKNYPALFKQYFGKLVPLHDNKFASLNSAFWSGGSFIYIPPHTHLELPLQAYFRINASSMGQFERTLIIADEGSFCHYIEGCTAPIYRSFSLHAAVVEIYVKKSARVRYTTIQNWSRNVFNLVTKRSLVEEKGIMEWVDGNLGSGVTMKYPSCILNGPYAYGEVLSLSFAGGGQILDTGAKMIHNAPNTNSQIINKSVSKSGGRSSFRGLVYINKGSKNAFSKVSCDAMILDTKSRSDTYPTIKVYEQTAKTEHEALFSKIEADQLFYLQSRGFTLKEASSFVVNGFVEPIVKHLPMEYAVELNRLIDMEMENSVG